jgi:hypothetical protein
VEFAVSIDAVDLYRGKNVPARGNIHYWFAQRSSLANPHSSNLNSTDFSDRIISALASKLDATLRAQ